MKKELKLFIPNMKNTKADQLKICFICIINDFGTIF